MHNIDALITKEILAGQELGPKDVMAWLKRKMLDEKYEEAFEKLESLLKRLQKTSGAPDDIDIYGLEVADVIVMAAEAQYLSGRFNACLEHLDKYTKAGLLEADDCAAELIRGWVLIQYDRTKEAMEIARNGLKRTSLTTSPLLHGQYLHLRGMCGHIAGNSELALDDLRDSLALFRQTGDRYREINALNALAVVESRVSSLSGACRNLEQSLQLLPREGGNGRKIQTLLNYAVILYKRGMFKEAEIQVSKAQAIQSGHRAELQKVRLNILRARIATQNNEHDMAMKLIEEVLDFSCRNKLAREEALALETMADLFLSREEHRQAERVTLRMQEVAAAHGMQKDFAPGVHRRLGQIFLARKEEGRAQKEFRACLEKALPGHDKIEEGLARRFLATCLRGMSQYGKAYAECRRSIGVFQRHCVDIELGRSYLEAARIRAGWHSYQEQLAEEDNLGAFTKQKQTSADAEEYRDHIEAAWSYSVEALHVFQELGNAHGIVECQEEMDLMRTIKMPSLTCLPFKNSSDGERVHCDLTEDPCVGEGMIAASPAMKKLLMLVDVAAATNEPVLITGETGTGKELIARRIHRLSSRVRKPIVAVNCAAIPETLFEREFFGNCRGAYTGADMDAPGFCEQADRGTLFLDEIGDLPLFLQAKLLRILQEGAFRRLGDPVELHADLRLVAATNAPLYELMAAGKFRRDLYYRLQTLEIHLPPLRERDEDIEPLIRLFLRRVFLSHSNIEELLSGEVLRALHHYPWPGNIRELEAIVRRLAHLARHTGQATLAMLPDHIAQWHDRPSAVAGSLDLATHLSRAENARIRHALLLSGDNRSLAARALGISRNTLYKKMEKLGIQGAA